MRKRQIGIVLRTFCLLVLTLFSACAQQMKSVQTEALPEVSSTAQIQSITVADDASRIEIISDKAIVYTYYMLENPPRVIVDIAQTAPGKQVFPLDINRGSVKRIDISKHEFGSGVLSRIDITLDSKAELTASLDQQDKKKLVLQFPVTVPQDKGAVAIIPEPIKPEKQPVVESAQEKLIVEAAPVAPISVSPVVEPLPSIEPKPVATEKTEAELVQKSTKAEPVDTDTSLPVLLTEPSKSQLKVGERALTAIKKLENGILLEFSVPPDSFKVFRLLQPDRLVLDVGKTKSSVATKIITINAFNLGKARIGTAPDNLRVVFDATGVIAKYNVVKNSSGLFIVFGENIKNQTTEKQVTAVSQQEPVKVESLPLVDAPSIAKIEAPEPAKQDTAISSQTPVAIDKPNDKPIVKPIESVVSSPLPTPAPVVTTVTAASPVVSSPPAPIAKPKTTVKKTVPGVVEAVEFTQADGISIVTIRTSGSCVAGEPVKTGKGFSLSIKGCRLPAKLQRQLDTSGFESAIRSIAPFSVKGGAVPVTKIAVNLSSSVPNTLNKNTDLLQWEFKEPVKVVKAKKLAKVPKAAAAMKLAPVAPLESALSDTKPEQPVNKTDKAMEDAFVLDKTSQPVLRHGKIYTGRKVTLEFSDADIKKIFQLLAEVSNQNILVSDDVTGTISLKLVNVPWDQALDVILENKGLGMQKDGNIVQIRPKTKMKSLDDEAVEMRLTEEKKMPLSTVIFEINFATLSEIETQFRNLKSKRVDSSISSDVRTNKIIVVDIDPNISKMRKLLEQLDVAEKQVMIEARIVEASNTFARDIGVKWNFGYQDSSASIANINNLTGSMGGVVSSVLPSATTGGVAAGMSFGKLLSNIQLDMRLSAASTVGQIKIISTPKVLTVNNKPAKISQGQMIPYQNTSSTEGAVTQFIEAALSLEVTPHITADGSVNMKIRASNNTAGVGSPPPINKKEATTELVVRNGETTVIGGIYVDSETEGDTGIPYLSDIPLFGWLFKSNSKSKTKNEMLIFITPKIMN